MDVTASAQTWGISACSLGLILLKVKDIGGAKETFDYAISIAPKDVELILSAAHALR